MLYRGLEKSPSPIPKKGKEKQDDLTGGRGSISEGKGGGLPFI